MTELNPDDVTKFKPYDPREKGQTKIKLMIVGEALGTQEALTGMPFAGSSGQELTRMLKDAGIDRRQCYITNTFWTQPPFNDIERFCGSKIEVGGKAYTHPPIRKGKYILPEYLPAIDRLRNEILDVKPNLILALGNIAFWALTQSEPKITRVRGTVTSCALVPGVKVLPTYHPAAIMRKWDWRAVAVADMMKAKREAESPDFSSFSREIWIDPDLEDIRRWGRKFITPFEDDFILGCDIETGRSMIKTIGFGTKTHAIIIPFVDFRQPDYSYWRTVEAERSAYQWCRSIIASRIIPKVFQNGLFDVQYVWNMGIPVYGFDDDTMLMHHAIQPELQKGLGFLASVYTNAPEWKSMRPRGSDELKREE